jgi:hypothetical protein
LFQREESITDYSKTKRYNDNVNLCEKHLKREFIRGLSPNIKYFALMDFDYDYGSIPIKSIIKFFRLKARYPHFPWDLPLDVLVKNAYSGRKRFND